MKKGPAVTPDAIEYLIEITSWDWAFYLGLGPRSLAPEDRLQGGFAYSRPLVVNGRFLEPSGRGGEDAEIWISGFAPDLLFAPDECREVGRLEKTRQPQKPYTARLMIPEADLPTAATALASAWKYIQIWAVDSEDEGISLITDFTFSRELPPNASE